MRVYGSLFSVLACVAALYAATDGVYTLHLEKALEDHLANRRVKFDVSVFLDIRNNAVNRAGSYSATYGSINGYGHYKLNPGPYIIDASRLRVSGDSLSGEAVLEIPEDFNAAYPEEILGTVTVTLDVDLAAGAGAYQGSSNLEYDHQIAGAVRVQRQEPQQGLQNLQVNAWLINPLASPVLADREYKFLMMLNFTVQNGQTMDMSAFDGMVRGSDEYDDTVFTAKGPMLVSAQKPYVVHDGDAELNGPALSGQFTVSGPDDGNENMVYEISGEAFGDNLLGAFTLKQGGQTIKSGALIGFMARPWAPIVGLPDFEPVVEAESHAALAARAMAEYESISLGKGAQGLTNHPGFYSGQTPYWTAHFGMSRYLYKPADGITGGSRKTGFEGPYFRNVSDYLPRVAALLRYLRDAPYHGPFAWDFTVSHVSKGGNKTYDNGCFIGYGVSVAMGLLEKLSAVEEEKQWARNVSRRAGDWLLAITGGPLDLPGEYYKTRVWYTAWAGYAYIDLYALTGEQKWLDAAKRLAQSFADMQRPSGTWTWADENSGELGSRTYSRESDEWYNAWEEISAAEFLYFLGRLRAECGVEEFWGVEKKALDWMRSYQARTHLWVHNGEVSRFNVRQPQMLSLYLLECAKESDRDLALAEELARMCEEKAVSWDRGYDLNPYVAEPHLRAGSLGSPPNTASATRLARIFIGLARETGNDLWLAKARALTHGVLSIQNMQTGEIYQHSKFGARGSLEAKRNYHFYKTETAVNLYHIGKELESLGTVTARRQMAPKSVRDVQIVGAKAVVYPSGPGRIRAATVYDALGKAVMRIDSHDSKKAFAFDISSAGVYVLVLDTPRGQQRIRFMVSRKGR